MYRCGASDTGARHAIGERHSARSLVNKHQVLLGAVNLALGLRPRSVPLPSGLERSHARAESDPCLGRSPYMGGV